MKKKLLSYVAFLCAVTAWGQEETPASIELVNAGFDDETSWVTANVNETNEVNGWTMAKTGSSCYSGAVGYGAGVLVNNASVDSNINGTTEGGTLGISLGWGGNVTYQQEVTLTAGCYTLKYNSYNANPSATAMNSLVGFVTDSKSYLDTKTSFVSGTWESNEVKFYLNEETTGKVQVGASCASVGSGSVAKVFFDDIELVPCTFSNGESWDFTANAGTTKDAWIGATGTYSTGVEYYTEASFPTGVILSQTIAGLPNGVYEVVLNANASYTPGRGSITTPAVDNGTENCSFAYANGQEKSLPVIHQTAISSLNEVVFATVEVTDGTLAVGIRTDAEGANWYVAQVKSIRYFSTLSNALYVRRVELDKVKEEANGYLSNDSYASVGGVERTDLAAKVAEEVEETAEAYDTAIADLQAAINAFVANAEIYEVLGREITKAEALGTDASSAKSVYASEERSVSTMTSAVQTLKLTEYAYVTTSYKYGVELGAWTTEGSTGANYDQHWSGESHKYLEQSYEAWKSASWNIKYAQDLTLPAGNYVFKVAGRRAAGDNCTLSLVVTDNGANTVLGTVNDFPEGDTGLGINKSGVTSFSADDAAGFANNNVGRGWEWRYVKFTLAEETSVNIAVTANATANYQWVSFCDATVQTDNEANISMIAYNIVLRDAKATVGNEAYANVTGTERTALQSAIDADPGTTTESIEAATEALNAAVTAFVGSLSSYNDLIAAKEEPASFVPEKLPYASDTKYEAVSEAVNVTPASGEDAVEKAAAIRRAYRAYIESNALAEAVATAVDKTTSVSNPLFADGTWDGWTHSQTGGTEQVLSNESFTDGEGNSDYHYYDYNNNGNNAQRLTQTISGLEAGRYLLTVTARGAASLNGMLLEADEASVEIPCIGNTGGQFGRGWNDVSIEFEHNNSASDVVIGVRATQGIGNHRGWFSFTRVRLVKLTDEVSVDVKVNPGKFATRIFPFVPDFGEDSDVKVYSCATADESNKLNLVEVKDPEANKPYILYSENGYENTLSGAGVATATEYKDGILVGEFAKKVITSGYVLQTLDEVQSFYKVDENDPVTVPAYRAYIEKPEAIIAGVNALALILPDGITTSIDGVVADDAIVNVYSVNGVLVRKSVKASDALRGLQPGLYIVNGVKSLVK